MAFRPVGDGVPEGAEVLRARNRSVPRPRYCAGGVAARATQAWDVACQRAFPALPIYLLPPMWGEGGVGGTALGWGPTPRTLEPYTPTPPSPTRGEGV